MHYVVHPCLKSHKVPWGLSWRHFEVKNLDNDQKWTSSLNLLSSKYLFYNFLLCKMLWNYRLIVCIVCCLSISWNQFGTFCGVILVQILKKKLLFFWHNCWIPRLELTHLPMFFSPFENIHSFVLLCTVFAYFRTQFKAIVTSLCPDIGHTTTN